MSSISRRSLVTTAAALPAIAVPAVAADHVGDDAELVQLAHEVKAEYDAVGDAIDACSEAEGKVWEWEGVFPKPKDDSEWIEWQRRKETIEREVGYVEAEELRDAASDRMNAAIDALARTRATSLRGLLAKARATSNDDGEMFDELRQSIVDDLLALDGEVVS